MILVTGGTGLVGSHLLRDLVSTNQPIRALIRNINKPGLASDLSNKVEWVNGDILDIPSLITAMEGVTHIYHCAAIVSFNPSQLNQMMQVNVEGTANIVNLAIDNNIKKMVYVSSIAALGKDKENISIDEDAYWVNSKKNTEYSLSKF